MSEDISLSSDLFLDQVVLPVLVENEVNDLVTAPANIGTEHNAVGK